MTNRLIQPPPKPALIAARPAAAATDGELLMRFSRHGDQEAFAEVVERHHAMVWGVCSRVLVRRADAEDAYQATLLILARKARAIRANDSAGGWLFRVAHNAALQTLRRRKALRETPLDDASLPAEAPFPDLEQKQLVVALLEELRAMPAKYQTPLVLRYLEGRSRREIAAATESTVATVAGHLVRGRRMLRSRLARRGVSLGLVLGAMGVGSTSHAAGTIRTSLPTFDPVLLSSGASTAVTSLVNQGVRSMFYASVTKPVAVGLAASLVAAVLLVGSQEGAAQSASDPGLQLGIAANEAAAASEEASRVKLAPNDQANDSSGRNASVRGAPGITRAGGRALRATGATAKKRGVTATLQINGELQEAGANAIENAFEGQKERYAEMAAKEGRTDYSQPSFEELYGHRNHWLNKQDALVSDMKALDRQTRKMAEAVAKGISSNDDYDRLQSDLLATRANLPLAKAKIAEYERLMKQAALRETRSKVAETRQPGRLIRRREPTAPYNFPPATPSTEVPSAKQPKPIAEHFRRQAGVEEIQVGERLIIEVYDRAQDEEVYSSELTVDEAGDVTFGSQWGRVSVANRSIRGAETMIRLSFEQEQRELQAILAKNDPDYEPEPISFSALVTRVKGSSTSSDRNGVSASPN